MLPCGGGLELHVNLSRKLKHNCTDGSVEKSGSFEKKKKKTGCAVEFETGKTG